jgi:hypothetical protein
MPVYKFSEKVAMKGFLKGTKSDPEMLKRPNRDLPSPPNEAQMLNCGYLA